jgi:hypothetical protein
MYKNSLRQQNVNEKIVIVLQMIHQIHQIRQAHHHLIHLIDTS